MSLKAKLESVIYAAEEPVTMAQLVGLFTDDALEYKAEQETAARADAVDGSPDGADASGAPSDEIDYAALTDDPGATTLTSSPLSRRKQKRPAQPKPTRKPQQFLQKSKVPERM